MTATCECGGRLDQQSRLPNAWVAADQQHRTAHETATGDTVEFGNPGDQARGIVGLAGQGLERKQAAFTGLATWPGGAFGAFLAERIPFPASLAFALPAAEGGTAVLADEGEAALGHGNRRKMAVHKARATMRTIQEQFLRRY